MAGYTRQDTANNISNGSVVDADDLDAEFNSIEAGFNASTGHAHDGSVGAGAPITKVGPAQDLVVSTGALIPKTTNTLDLGTDAIQFKDAWFDGTVDTDALAVSGNSSVGGILTVTGGTVSDVTGDLTGNVIGNLTGNVTGTTSSISNHTTDALTEGVSNLYFNNTRARNAVSATGSLSYNNSTGVFSFTQGSTDTVPEGTTNLYYTAERAIADVGGSFSIVDTGGDGSLALVGSAITYTGPSAAETRAHFTAGTGIAIDSGEIGIDPLGNPTIANLVITGDLTVQGTTTSVSSQDVSTTNTFIVLNSDEAGTPSADSGIEVERGTSANKKFYWDETLDRWSTGADPLYATAFLGNATTATTLQTTRNIQLTGDVTGTATFNGSANAVITAVVADDSHNHIIANVDGLQTALDGKATTAQGALADTAVQPNDNVTFGSVTATSLSGTINSSNLTGALPALNGSALTNMHGVNGAARGFISFNGATGGVIASDNITLVKDSTGNYTLTVDAAVRDASANYCVVVGAVDKGIDSQTPISLPGDGSTSAEVYTAYVASVTASTITIRGRNLYNSYMHFGGNDNNTAGAWGITSVDPTYITVVIY